MVKKLSLPLNREVVHGLQAGDEVALSGVVVTARDEAHRRLVDLLEARKSLPVRLENSIIFYAGPTPARPGSRCGAVGPTTSKRMDPFTPRLLEAGVAGMIGKGPRSPEVVSAIRHFGAVYFVATGGAAALLSTFVRSCEPLAWPELGPEAIWRLELNGFPAFVAIDPNGKDLFARGWASGTPGSGEAR